MFVCLKWASDLWLSIQSFSFLERKLLWVLGWGSKERPFTPPPHPRGKAHDGSETQS